MKGGQHQAKFCPCTVYGDIGQELFFRPRLCSEQGSCNSRTTTCVSSFAACRNLWSYSSLVTRCLSLAHCPLQSSSSPAPFPIAECTQKALHLEHRSPHCPASQHPCLLKIPLHFLSDFPLPKVLLG